MTRLLKITDLGSGIMVQGTNNVLYPDNATLTYPYNSIIVVTDESNIATFRSASNNDVLFSGLIGKIEIGGEIVTKENINTKFDAIANKESGGGGDVTGLFADASYDSQTKRINFYDNGGNIVSYIDATGFIKDGMVSNVAISEGNLVITFNTDAGQEPISIALTDIFNAANYYNKTEVDGKLALKADKSEIPDTSEFITKAEYNPKELATAKALTQLNETKADKTELPDVSTFATKTELNAKANTADLAAVATSGSYNDLTNKPSIPDTTNLATKTELNAKQDALVSGTNIKTVNNQSILGEGNITIEGGMDENTELLISSALVDLNDRKIDATEVKENYQNKGDYATNAKVDTKANISDVPTNEDYEEAQKITSWSLNDLNARFGGVRLQIITQSDYDALATKDSSTVYFIKD